jgi:hypothetical protein
MIKIVVRDLCGLVVIQKKKFRVRMDGVGIGIEIGL